MTAHEARKAADSVTTVAAETQLKQIDKKINYAATRGLYQVLYSQEDLLPQVKEELERRGFTVKETSDYRDGNFTTISW